MRGRIISTVENWLNNGGRSCKFALGLISFGLCLFAQQASGTETVVETVESLPLEQPEKSELRAAFPAFDPGNPGADLPPAGRSLFDDVFAALARGGDEYALPFPFSKLVEYLEQYLPPGTRVKQVLIPLGRSLQRHTAEPDFFRYPRVVAAIVDEASHETLRLRDRLYLGYQEKGDVIEVISFNDQAGRFEFQVVNEYAAGASARISYASRRLCTSCHQNGGPVFSRAAWSETAANPAIHNRLLSESSRFYNIPVHRSGADAFAVDASVERANLLPVWQLIWNQGCGSNSIAARKCRAAAYRAALQLALNGRHFDDSAALFKRDFLAHAKNHWSSRWPDGIGIADPKLPNRDPLPDGGKVQPPLDPLSVRPFLETWTPNSDEDVQRLVSGIADGINENQINQLDEVLFRGREFGSTESTFESFCGIKRESISETDYKLVFDCIESPGIERTFSMAGRLYVRGNIVSSGTVDTLTLDGVVDIEKLLLESDQAKNVERSLRVILKPRQRRNGRHARLPNGNAIKALVLDWRFSEDAISAESDETFGGASLVIQPDFSAVDELIERHSSHATVFQNGALRPEVLTSTLIAALSARSDVWRCCSEHRAGPDQRARERAASTFDAVSIERSYPEALNHYCGDCHGVKTAFPPDFLFGHADRVHQFLRHCAERIWYRLAMWRTDENRRPKSPMPPWAMLHSTGLNAEEWINGQSFAGISGFIQGLISDDGTDPGSLLQHDYESLQPCTL